MKKENKMIIYDFDNVLYNNPYSSIDFKDDLKISRFISKKYLPIKYNKEDYNILITGRGKYQSKKLIELLEKKGYKFDEYIFFRKFKNQYPHHNPNISLESYFKDYYNFKFNTIKKYIDKNTKFYQKIIVIDDNTKIIEDLKNHYKNKKNKTKIKFILFNCKNIKNKK